MYTSAFFPAEYFPRAYFPRPAAEKVKYFFHGEFPSRYFTDSYFPGEFVTVIDVPPEPPIQPEFFGGGAPARHHIPSVTAVWDLELHVPIVDVLGYVTEIIRGMQDLQLPRPRIHASGTMQPAGMQAQWSLPLPRLAVDISGQTARPAPPTRRSDHDVWEEDMLLEHYMLSLKDYQ